MQRFKIIENHKALQSTDKFFNDVYNKRETQTSIQQYMDECKCLIKDDPDLSEIFDGWFKDLYTRLVVSDKGTVLSIVKHYIANMLEGEFNKYCRCQNKNPNTTPNPTAQYQNKDLNATFGPTVQ